ncbi:MAG: hypothetical protein JOZ12_05820 [Sinobacteraceae bacterium]|nr:hypothetical protein [Nevskiaceae bacterium]
MAGVPREVICQARRYLEKLESSRDRQTDVMTSRGPQQELPLFGKSLAPTGNPEDRGQAESASVRADTLRADNLRADPLRAALEAVDPDQLSPRAALETLYELRRLLSEPKP